MDFGVCSSLQASVLDCCGSEWLTCFPIVVGLNFLRDTVSVCNVLLVTLAIICPTSIQVISCVMRSRFLVTVLLFVLVVSPVACLGAAAPEGGEVAKEQQPNPGRVGEVVLEDVDEGDEFFRPGV